MNKKGLLIVIDGLDGSGKNTQANMLYNFFKNSGIEKVIKLSFPDYDYYTGKTIREMLKGELDLASYNLCRYDTQFIKSLLFSFDRMICMHKKMPEFNNKSIRDLYMEGYIIICDRYTTSNFFHMTIDIDENNFDTEKFVNELEEIEYEKMFILKPDIVITLLLDPEISMKLIEKRGNERDEHENLIHLKKAYDKLKYILSIKPDWKVINCNNDEGDFIKDQLTIQNEIRSVLRDCVSKELINEIIHKIDINGLTICPKCNNKLIQMIFEPEKYYCPNCDSVWIK